MALIDLYNALGSGIVTSLNSNVRKYRVYDDANQAVFVEYYETTKTETRIWVGCTYNLAVSVVEAASQPTDPNETYSWSFQEDNRVVGSYTIQRDSERKVTSIASEVVGAVSAPTANPTGTTSFPLGTPRVTFPLSLVVSTTTPNCKIRGSIWTYTNWSTFNNIWNGPIDIITLTQQGIQNRNYGNSPATISLNPPAISTPSTVNATKIAAIFLWAEYTTTSGQVKTSPVLERYFINTK